MIRPTALLLALLAILAVAPSGRADTLAYVTGGSTIFVWDTTTNTVAPLVNSANGGVLDSLIFDGTGTKIIYSIIGTNNIGIYNMVSQSNAVLNTSAPVGPGAADMTLEPSRTTFLLSNAQAGATIQRINPITGATTTLSTGAQLGNVRPDGLAYDNNGHLFVVLNTSQVAQIDPTTGAILKTISTPNQADGFDV